jgi:hypothetical protein
VEGMTPELPKADWTPEQAVGLGDCHHCEKVRRLRTEPFGQTLVCRTCWEQICYGEED